MAQKYKKILITGANGLLGTNVVKTLDSRGIDHRAIVRRSNSTLDGAKHCEVVIGNVLDAEDMRRAADQCDAIVHICAITDQSLLKYSDYANFNVGSLRGVIETARQCGIKRVVFVSSSNTVGCNSSDYKENEDVPAERIYKTQLYGRSKIEAESLLFQSEGIEGVVVNPCFMIGPYDSKPSSGELIMMGYGKRVVFASSGVKNIVDVEAAAAALCDAIENGRAGQRYLLAGENISLKDYFKLISRLDGVKKCIVILPRFMLVGVGYIGDFVRWLGIRFRLSSLNMKAICVKENYTGKKASKELSLPSTNIEGCTIRAIEWFRAEGMLKR